MAKGLFLEADFSKLGIAKHQIADDKRHLDREFPLLFFFFLGESRSEWPNIGAIEVFAFGAFFFDPFQGFFIFFVVVDS